MRRDFLAAAFAGALYTDLAQRLIPSGLIPLADRAEALERSWEQSWDDVLAKLRADTPVKTAIGAVFSNGFARTWAREIRTIDGVRSADPDDPIKPWPILLLNGTNVETGRRVITSNVDAVTDKRSKDATRPCVAAPSAQCSVWEAPAVDDPFTTLKRDMRVSTAVNMSARFPIIEPAGGIVDPDTGKRAYHVVDGGIYENFGAETIADVLRYFVSVRPKRTVAAESRARREVAPRIRPLVILVSSDHELDGVRQAASAYAGKDDPEMVERKMTIGCDLSLGKDSKVPLCNAKLLNSANEVLGDPIALYRTRSGRGESGILSIREILADRRYREASYSDEDFFHFRQCMNGSKRPASMTWYVSSVSRQFMNHLLPSTVPADEANDPCQNQVELKRLLGRASSIRGENGN